MKKLLSFVLAAVILTVSVLSLSACSKVQITKEDLVVPEGACTYLDTRDTTGRDIRYVMLTVKDYGSMIILLDATTAPITVNNFMKLVNRGFYDGLTFHRVMSDFMIQGGCPKGDGTGDSEQTIKGEFSQNGVFNDLTHKYGVISMARKSDPYRDSASCQFFICNSNSASVKNLNGKYAAFGYVIAGLSVVDYITYYTASYGDSNGGIADKSKQAVIGRIIEISESEAMSYVNNNTEA